MSGYSTTPNLGLKKPISGADDDLWGTHWNDNADLIDSIVGPLGTPPAPSSAPPLMDGVADPGTSALYAREGHVHPSDTTRQTAAQVQAAVAPAFNGVGRNLIHNPLFNIAQRGGGPWTATGYTADRWKLLTSLDTANVSVQPMPDVVRPQVGDEAVRNAISITTTANAGAAAFTEITHNIEGIDRLAGKTVTLSFYAVVATANSKIGINGYQDFGAGGSPSAPVAFLTTGLSITPGIAWARYSLTFAVPSSAGKVLGTAGSSQTVIQFWFSSGATNNAAAGNIGVQSNTFQLWGVQLEIGSVATPLEKPDPRYDLSNCQRFYQTSNYNYLGYIGAANPAMLPLPLPTTMRATPLVTGGIITSTNLTGANVIADSASMLRIVGTGVALGAFQFTGTYTASADL